MPVRAAASRHSTQALRGPGHGYSKWTPPTGATSARCTHSARPHSWPIDSARNGRVECLLTRAGQDRSACPHGRALAGTGWSARRPGPLPASRQTRRLHFGDRPPVPEHGWLHFGRRRSVPEPGCVDLGRRRPVPGSRRGHLSHRPPVRETGRVHPGRRPPICNTRDAHLDRRPVPRTIRRGHLRRRSSQPEVATPDRGATRLGQRLAQVVIGDP